MRVTPLVVPPTNEAGITAKTMPESSPRYSEGHRGALRRFAVAITALTVLGHTVLGFEQSFIQPLVALAAAYSVQIVLETAEAWAKGRRPRIACGYRDLFESLLSPHISGLAIAMLLYFNDQLWIVAFGSAAAIASKTLFRAPINGEWRHFFNPSNFGITLTLLSCPWVGLLMPWQFTTELSGTLDWLLPAGIVMLGAYLHAGFARRLPLIVAWLASFVLQAAVRAVFFQSNFLASIAPMTGVPFVLFTFYMVPDPATTPVHRWPQAAFGAAVGILYGFLMALHVVYGLFIALTIVCALRGCSLYVHWLLGRPYSGGKDTRS